MPDTAEGAVHVRWIAVAGATLSALQAGIAAAVVAASRVNEITGPERPSIVRSDSEHEAFCDVAECERGGDPEHDSSGYQRNGPAHEHSEDVPLGRTQSRSNAYFGCAHLDELGNDPVETNHGQEQGETSECDK